MGRKLDSSFDKVDQSYFMNYSNTYSFFKKFSYRIGATYTVSSACMFNPTTTISM